MKLKEKFNCRLKTAVLKKFTEKRIDGIIGTLGEVFHELSIHGTMIALHVIRKRRKKKRIHFGVITACESAGVQR